MEGKQEEFGMRAAGSGGELRMQKQGRERTVSCLYLNSRMTRKKVRIAVPPV